MSGFEVGSEGYLRESIVAISKKLYRQKLVAGSAGSISARVQSGDTFISPFKKSRDTLQAVGVVLLNDKSVGGLSKENQAEAQLHQEIYKKCPKALAVIFAHPINALALSLIFPAGTDFPLNILPSMEKEFGKIPHVAYQEITSPNWKSSALDYVTDHSLILLSRHGVVSYASTLEDAILKIERFEHFCKTLVLAHAIGTPKKLN